MSRQIIDTTTNNGTYTGDPAKTAFNKANDNFEELYQRMEGMIVGNYANRPDPATVFGREYYAIDVKERYTPAYGGWLLLPSGGTELGFAQISSNFTTTAVVDVPGLTVTVKVGENPVVVTWGGTTQSANEYYVLTLWVDNVNVSQILFRGTSVPEANGSFINGMREFRVAGLTPGQMHTFKVQFGSVGSTPATLYGLPTDKAFIHVRTC
ncbi:MULTISPECIES: hypothetical protein [Stenotrophomonas]|uniref:hypothetical protein n=1 Tax=Stenotrophomonas TaxID=40323 RepID=UPI0008723ECE|nr:MULTISPECIES: hypothetical protein [Stenotrophomonas]OEZ02326.1 hypothetical protein BIY45_02010 [Stenotrophomonas sp. BIIR7]